MFANCVAMGLAKGIIDDTCLVFFLFQALCGTRIEVPTLMGGEKFALNLSDEIVKPNTVKRFPGKGLPHPKDTGKKGDLLVGFDIIFPERLSSSTKDTLRASLPNQK